MLTCAFSSWDVWTCLVPEQEPGLVRARVDHWRRTTALPGTPIVREGEWRAPSERAFDGGRVRPEHRVECVVASDFPAQFVQAVTSVAVSCNTNNKAFVKLSGAKTK